MITKIEVDGFKSLSNFDLFLTQGLNILVGPNGAGKTNIILFFEFLSNISSNQIGNAVSSVGGAGAIFQKIGKEDYRDTIKSNVYGSYQTHSKKFIVYEYSFEIKISFEKDNVYFSNQRLKLRTTSRFWESPDTKNYTQPWDIDIEYPVNEELKNNIIFHALNTKKIEARFLSSSKGSKKEFEDNLRDFIIQQNPIYYSLIRSLIPFNDFIHNILTDLKGGETFNIVPSRVRELEDSATPPGIKKDGSGLATTLYAMKKSKTKQSERQFHFWYYSDEPEREYKPKTLETIISYLKLANSTITTLNVDNDPFNNKLVVKITIKTGSYEAILPLSSMSDGTIKWLTLITGILTSKTIFSIEEPENFLHPWMQAEIANIMRNHLEEKKARAFVLMTTHSESLLNYAKPEEIIIVDLQNGKTSARRISNINLLKEEISNSGFGLGHFYFSNVLANE